MGQFCILDVSNVYWLWKHCNSSKEFTVHRKLTLGVVMVNGHACLWQCSWSFVLPDTQCRWSEMSTSVHLLVGNVSSLLVCSGASQGTNFWLGCVKLRISSEQFFHNIWLWQNCELTKRSNQAEAAARAKKKQHRQSCPPRTAQVWLLHCTGLTIVTNISRSSLALFAPPFLHSGLRGVDGGGSKDGIWETKSRTSRPRVGIYKWTFY